MPAPISRFPVPDLAALLDDIRQRIEAVQEKAGFVPNVFLTLAWRPDEFRAFMAYHDALMEREGGLTPAEREMIVVATSAANDCQYCVIAHGAILRIRAKNPLLADQSEEAPALAGPQSAGVSVQLGQEEDDDAMIDLDLVEGRVKASTIKKITEIVERHPEETVSILRQWMYQDA